MTNADDSGIYEKLKVNPNNLFPDQNSQILTSIR